MYPISEANPLTLVAAGFLPTRGSFMLDFVFLAIFVIPIVLAYSIYLVRIKKQFKRHKQIQLVTAAVVLVTIVAFEVDLRLFTNWRRLAEPSSLYDAGWVDVLLWIHLCFAVPTPIVWLITVVGALRNFPHDPVPCQYSRKHRLWGRASAGLMFMTSLTGCVFYVVAFAL